MMIINVFKSLFININSKLLSERKKYYGFFSGVGRYIFMRLNAYIEIET